MTCFSIVIPANASDPAHALRRFELDPGFRRGDEWSRNDDKGQAKPAGFRQGDE